MKKICISSTVGIAVLAGALLLAPSRVQAATAHAKFVAMRNALSRALSDGELTISCTASGNNATFSVLLDGSPLPPDIPVTVSGDAHTGYTEFTVKIDFSDSVFSSVTFGKDQNTLKLVPKAAPKTFDTVQLDPQSGKPFSWTHYAPGTSKPLTTINYRPKESKTPTATSDSNPAPFDGVVTAHIRVAHP